MDMIFNKKIQFNTEIWQEGNMFVAYAPQLDVSSCGKSVSEARRNISEAVELFIEEAEKMGTLDKILEESGFVFDKEWKAPELVSQERISLVI